MTLHACKGYTTVIRKEERAMRSVCASNQAWVWVRVYVIFIPLSSRQLLVYVREALWKCINEARFEMCVKLIIPSLATGGPYPQQR